jgi:hypothetical protein
MENAYEVFYVHMTVHRNKFLYNETNICTNFQIYSGTKLYKFRAVYLPVISFPLHIWHCHKLHRFEDSLCAGSILILHACCHQTCITLASA